VVAQHARNIHQALTVADPRDSVEGIKLAVIDELTEFDPRMHIKATEYFNHTFSPDLVASWPHDPSIGERYIYLRYSSQPEYLLEDVELVADNHPIVFSLNEPFAVSDVDLKISDVSRRADTLVTDAYGIEKFIEGRTSEFIGLISTAIAQGGRGFVDQPSAEENTENLSRGFDGALSVLRDPTRKAAETIQNLLTENQANRAMRLLQAVWVGAGGRMEDFPGPRWLAGDIADDALQFLLEYRPIGDIDFWRRLGQKVDISQLSRMNLPKGSSNLDTFMYSNRDILWARSCRVKLGQDRLSEGSSGDLKWLVEASFLTLQGADFSAYVAQNSDATSKLKHLRGTPISIDELINRTEDVAVNEVDLAIGDKHLRYTSTGGQTVAEDETLSGLTGAIGPGARVKRVGIALQNARNVSCDFITSTASARTNSKINLSELLVAIVPVLRAMPTEKKQQLRAFLGFDISSQGQTSLI
jgi:hypothetical protein